METRFVSRIVRRIKPSAICRQTRYFSSSKPSNQQVNPIGDYYASILSSITPSPSKSPSKSSPVSTSTTNFETKSVDSTGGPAIIFSSRLSSPLERRAELAKKSVLVAGVWVPPKPGEPDNCCMSGCVNCVWDRYGDEIEEWAAAKKSADRALKREQGLEKIIKREKKRKVQEIVGTGLMLGEGEKGAQHTMTSMDDDGGGSESNWGADIAIDTDLFKGVPVGIREFMKQERRLKEKHARDGTSGG